MDIFPADPFEREAIEQAQEVEYEGVRTKVFVPEYLIALFLRAGRDKNLRKVEMLWEQCDIDKQKLSDILDRYGLYARFKAFEEGKI